MTDPIKALADAARRARVVLHNMTLERYGKLRMFSRWQISDEPLRNDAMHVVPAIDEALAAYDAAQAQPVHRPVGITGERDPDHPCEEFAPGSPDPGRCLGDGHYLCNECRHYYAPEDTTEDTTNG